jgi:hypothetical protein
MTNGNYEPSISLVKSQIPQMKFHGARPDTQSLTESMAYAYVERLARSLH